MTVPPSGRSRVAKRLKPFATALQPLFIGRSITYVDVGAYTGEIYVGLRDLGLKIHDAHLVEANPETFERLAPAFEHDDSVVMHQVALGDAEGTVHLELRDTMSRVVAEGGSRKSAEVSLTTLDALMERAGVDHIDLLKIDVEGSELGVLSGAAELLQSNSIDVIYIEAGMSGASTQHVDHREIEAVLEPYGYRLMGVYEQTHEWIRDLPTLRRANLGFVSKRFAESHPFRLSRELMDARRSVEQLEQERDHLTAALMGERSVGDSRKSGGTLPARAADAELASVRAERDALEAWALETDRRLRRVIGSRWWRLTRYPRGAVRRVRTRLGKPVMGPVAPPPRPLVGRSRASEASNADFAHVMRSVSRRRLGELSEHVRILEAGASDRVTWVQGQAAQICFDYIATAYEFVAQAAETLRDRLDDPDDELRRILGRGGYSHVVTVIAKSCGRLSRYDEALVWLDAAIAAGFTDLRVIRAELLFTTDQSAALADVEAFLKGAPQDHPQRNKADLLRSHLVLDGQGSVGSVTVAQAQQHVAHAMDARARRDVAEYARHVNAFFESHGLVGALPPTIDSISGLDWTSPAAPASDHDALVSVVMTTFNSEGTLAHAVASLLVQTHARLEILIVDDGSTDGTLDVAQRLARSDARIRLLATDCNSGTYAAKNLAIGMASGEYVTFHDSDDWAHPQRVERHLDAMATHPELVATRSEWLRVSATGAIEFRRWGLAARHPNPASVFIRREAFQQVGVFDTVRFGADSEFWFRLRELLPKGSVSSLQLPLAIGLHHENSLTRAGAGAWTSDHYSANRSAYQLSWTEFHATAAQSALPRWPDQTRAFWAPETMLREPLPSDLPATRASAYPIDTVQPAFVFAISMRSQSSTRDWDRAVELLDRTLHSLVGQSDPRWSAIICGHERPAIDILDDPRITFIACPEPAPTKSSGFRADKAVKRRIIAAHARGLGGGYFFPLDADDLVHRDVVAHVRADDNRRGYMATQGYAEDYEAGRIAPIPGAWTLPFDRVCGSAIVLYFEREDLPRWHDEKSSTYFDLFSHHAYWAGTAEEFRGPLDPLPFAAGVYVLNTGVNLSFGLQRANQRKTNIIDSIERHQIDARMAVLRDDFGQR